MKSRLAALFYALLIFGSGAAVGALSQRFLVSATVKGPSRHDEYRQRYIEETRARLGLNAAQLAELEEILDATRERYRALNRSKKPEMEAIQADQTRRILEMLEPEQREAFHKLQREREERRKSHSGC